jgi:lipid-A-disaccharide synthase
MVAGEASGDLHGADLLHALHERLPEVDVVGVGGEHCRAAGMQAIADASETGTVGLVEGARALGTLVRTYRALVRLLREDPPDLCVLVDFPEFNLRLARQAKKAGVPVLYYIAPQVWAWRRGRVRKIARRVDRLAVVFPFEPGLYEARLPGVEFVGHPLLDRVAVTRARDETLRLHGLDPARRLVLLLPGSRTKEIDYILPSMVEAVRRLAADHPDLQFALALAHTLTREQVAPALAAVGVPIPVVAGDMHNLVAASEVAIVASGTATLECALLEKPMVIVYRLSRVTFALARLLVRGVQHVGMPNIVAGRAVVPELLQREATGERIAAEAAAILDHPAEREAMVAGLREVRRRLGRGGAARRAAAIAAEMMGVA